MAQLAENPFIKEIQNWQNWNDESTNGLVVQLVRIHACHAWGRGFESRPDRS